MGFGPGIGLFGFGDKSPISGIHGISVKPEVGIGSKSHSMGEGFADDRIKDFEGVGHWI